MSSNKVGSNRMGTNQGKRSTNTQQKDFQSISQSRNYTNQRQNSNNNVNGGDKSNNVS
jgi:hypothetical protein